jgi:hypothetical protein
MQREIKCRDSNGNYEHDETSSQWNWCIATKGNEKTLKELVSWNEDSAILFDELLATKEGVLLVSRPLTVKILTPLKTVKPRSIMM